jgi:hypothetical protein
MVDSNQLNKVFRGNDAAKLPQQFGICLVNPFHLRLPVGGERLGGNSPTGGATGVAEDYETQAKRHI